MTSCGDGTCTVRNTRPCAVSSMPLLAMRTCFSITSFSGSLATSVAFTKRCAPLATSVTTITARRAARSAFSVLSRPRSTYFTFSTKTRMVPPQDRPTFHAVSSATPNSRTFGLPLSITSSASVTTAPSTQPPDTLPRKFPSLSITRLEPTGRGAEPQVSTTVASATPRPSLRQLSAALRMSSSRESMLRLHFHFRHARPCPGHDQNDSSHFPQPQPRIDVLGRVPGQRLHQFRHRLQIVDRPQFVNMRQHGFYAAGARFETLETQQRIEPDQAAARAVQP